MLGGTHYEWEGAVDLGFHVVSLMDKDLLPQACGIDGDNCLFS